VVLYTPFCFTSSVILRYPSASTRTNAVLTHQYQASWRLQMTSQNSSLYEGSSSFTRTTISRPFFVLWTVTYIPSGSVLCAAVMAYMSYFSPLLVFRPWKPLPYQLQFLSAQTAHGLVVVHIFDPRPYRVFATLCPYTCTCIWWLSRVCFFTRTGKKQKYATDKHNPFLYIYLNLSLYFLKSLSENRASVKVYFFAVAFAMILAIFVKPK